MFRRAARSEKERTRPADAFDTLVDPEMGYAALEARIIKTADKRAQVLAVLEHPDLPVHHNGMERGARRQVRNQSRTGARAWATFPRLAATAAKLGVGFYHYFRDRLVSPDTTLALGERIAERAGIAVSSSLFNSLPGHGFALARQYRA